MHPHVIPMQVCVMLSRVCVLPVCPCGQWLESVCLLSRALRHCAICNQAGSQEAHIGAHMAGHLAPAQSPPTQSHVDICTCLCSTSKREIFVCTFLTRTLSSPFFKCCLCKSLTFCRSDPNLGLLLSSSLPNLGSLLKSIKKKKKHSSTRGCDYATFPAEIICQQVLETGNFPLWLIEVSQCHIKKSMCTPECSLIMHKCIVNVTPIIELAHMCKEQNSRCTLGAQGGENILAQSPVWTQERTSVPALSGQR